MLLPLIRLLQLKLWPFATSRNCSAVQAVPALPSKRYLKILQKGAKRSNLAAEYQIYLQALQHYQASTIGQRIGQALNQQLFGRILTIWMTLLPVAKSEFLCWVIHQFFASLVQAMWLCHDHILQPILGSGRHN